MNININLTCVYSLTIAWKLSKLNITFSVCERVLISTHILRKSAEQNKGEVSLQFQIIYIYIYKDMQFGS